MSRTYKDKKLNYFAALEELIETCPKILIISVDFVRSLQMQNVRAALRGKATILMGKNTMIRTCLRSLSEKRPDLNLEALVAAVNGNIGFCFVHSDIAEIRTVLAENKMPAAAKMGVISSKDVVLPSGPTGLDPSQTNFFQALNIPTKIVKGTIELLADFTVCKTGSKVSASEAVLLGRLAIKPFEYGIVLKSVFDNGSVYDAAVLDITDDVVSAKFLAGVQNIAAISREIGVPTEASLPHAVTNAVKNMAALCADIDFTFPEIQKLKDFLADPSAFASAAPAAAAAGGAAPAAAAAAPAEEEEEEEMDFDLFG